MSDAGKPLFGNAIPIPSSDFATMVLESFDNADLTGKSNNYLPDAIETVVLGTSTFQLELQQ